MLRTSSAGRSHVRKRGRIVSDGQIAAIFLALLLLSLLCVGLAACAVHFASGQPTAKEGAESETLPVSDIPMPKVIPAGRTMPLYLQDDVQWAHIEYAGDSTVAESGCGLTCAAMALEYLTNQKTTPRDLQGIVGDTCTVHGVNDMALFGDYMEQAYGLSQSEIYYDLNQAVADEARFFIDSCRNYFGEAIPVLDWEEELSAGVSWAKEFLDAVYAETGVKPLLYASKSVLREYDWSSVANAGYGLWFAQYANYNATGYQDSPWTDNGGIGAWPFPAMFQYSSAGSLPGWNGSLDLNIFFGDESAWDAYASAGSGSTEPNAEPVKSVDDIAHEVIAGAWGNGDERRARLAAAGYDFDTVQGRVNDLLGANRQRIYTVVAGDTLSGIGAKLGVDWRSIASSNGISSPYTIYPGDQLTY